MTTTARGHALLERVRIAAKEVVDEWVREHAQESVRLEFKTKSNPDTSGLDPHDRTELARAICGLANTSGGFVGFGFETKPRRKGEPDEVTRHISIADVARCKGRIEAEIHEWHDPALRGLEVFEVETDGGRGVIVIRVPASEAGPHRVNGPKIEAETNDRYFMRTVSSTIVMPHAMLSALFGVRPEPVVRVFGNLDPRQGAFTLSVRNVGRGTAKQLAVAVRLSNHFEWRAMTPPDWMMRAHAKDMYVFLRETLPLFPQMEDRFAIGNRRSPNSPGVTLVSGGAYNADSSYIVDATVFTDGRPRRYSGEIKNVAEDTNLREIGILEDDG